MNPEARRMHSQEATWFLSYCFDGTGYVDIGDIFLGALVGTVTKEFLGLKVGTEIQILASTNIPRRFHVKVCPDGYESDDGDVWFVTTAVSFDFVVGDIISGFRKEPYVE